MALVFARPPLALYDTWSPLSFQEPDARKGLGTALEWIYGCTIPVIILFARVNAWRAGLRAKRYEVRRDLETEAKSWSFPIDLTDSSVVRVVRLAVQESWRQAAIIYLYMGMCRLDSTDPRVEGAVDQVANLVGIIPAEDIFEKHVVLPCLIAGIAARLEAHRRVLRRKLAASGVETMWCLKGNDFVCLLDRVWDGPGRNGRRVLWDDYSRCVRDAYGPSSGT
ncbi:Fungal specific transcription factor domain [Ceratobasidium sp. AG-Ba]|nr:Fungal specific transcription factor domain [Ceratobasidium sp. AG-Ba]QRW11271.1 Fungal specific transcription factor domain [Ceratobasidium sp. AG-Ba]